MSSLTLETEPLAVDVEVTEEELVVRLLDGRRTAVPLAWYPLWHATPTERQRWQLLGEGYAIQWPDIDEHIRVEGLLAGRPSGESAESLTRWLASRGIVKEQSDY